MENQVLGLAEAIAAELPLQIAVKRVGLSAPVRWLPYGLLGSGAIDPRPFLSTGSDAIAPPWPDLLIGCGRLSVPVSLTVKRLSFGRTYTVQTQHPRVSTAKFDLVLPPFHDGLEGPNVLPLLGSPHRVNARALEEGRARFDGLLGGLPRPLIAVLIGGDSKSHRLTQERMTTIADALAALAQEGHGLAVTTSRRTGAENEAILRAALEGTGAYLWDGTGENPYFGLLAHADHVMATADSTNMVVEAAATGKPVHVLALDGGSAKFDRFHEAMRVRGITRDYRGRLEHWTYEPLDETARAARYIAAALDGNLKPEGMEPLNR